MTYVHQKINLNTGDTVIIDSSHSCRAYLMHEWEYNLFLENKDFRYADRSDTARNYYESTTAKLHVSCGGTWDMLLLFDTFDKEKFRYTVDVLPELS